MPSVWSVYRKAAEVGFEPPTRNTAQHSSAQYKEQVWHQRKHLGLCLIIAGKKGGDKVRLAWLLQQVGQEGNLNISSPLSVSLSLFDVIFTYTVAMETQKSQILNPHSRAKVI